MLHTDDNIFVGGNTMNKTISMSIRVSEEELDKLKQTAQIEACASYSEFIRRTALKEAERVIEDKKRKKKMRRFERLELYD